MQAAKTNNLTYQFKFGKSEPISFFLCSDVHIDNPKCDRELFFAHLKKARDKGAKVLVNGDLFCLMQGKYDPRRSKKDIRPEHNVANYIDAVIEDTVELLSPYADILAFVGEGNHETAILKNCETDVLTRFVERFNERNKVNVLRGGYRGWINILAQANDGNVPYRIYYNHGFGGGGEMTKGILQHSRTNMYIENADAIWMGHVHEMYALPTQTERFNANASSNMPETRTVYNLRTGCYKEEFADAAGGFHIERGRQPKPMGGILCQLELMKKKNRSNYLYPSYTIITK
jgi:UDP-2,3-diacylglucosamine pyrophosphatase LpxH